ncbi:hypothetical protein [Methylibium petroleiphilum]|uniref:Uncharacterized protein n=1 Tax=Methylibium petroleiphilum (strain ATCC BAA-1232 / LMG 22953 / PM1) TaxID=420662 RepID=A2SF17_METPP|nr:hypothetical protein [Methylibium petroleiphilum]ABM94156.1 hypothetical protein Mpe_A1193 [Methylibium petroleiphilum PM1]ABM96966.1 hypothetical protein Mpe_B0190 [Methylibium petroleiphilum PM1]
MGLKRCLACADAFQTSARVPTQNYCSRPECQRERRKLWQREKRHADGDYRANQLQCQRRWRESHTDYWQQYRAEHPGYVERNRRQQQVRNAMRQPGLIAKMDAIPQVSPLASGTYHLTPAEKGEIAKMDAWIVKITLLSGT